jgi:DNA uptake protein ComE-like DNA-binding protein
MELSFERNRWGGTAGLVVASAFALTTWPAVSQPQPPATSQAETPPAAAKKPVAPKKVDLNNATLAELKTLPTVGDAEAKKIIAHRPYKSKGELVTKAGLPEGVYHAVKHKVELQTPRKPAPKK